MENQPKISSVEAVLMLSITIAADLWEIFGVFLIVIPFVGWAIPFVNIVVSLLVWLIIQFWLIMKGIPGWWFVGGGIIDLIPGISAFPCKTAAMLKIIIQHSDIAETALKVVGKVPLPQAKAAQAALKVAKTAGKITSKA